MSTSTSNTVESFNNIENENWCQKCLLKDATTICCGVRLCDTCVKVDGDIPICTKCREHGCINCLIYYDDSGVFCHSCCL